LLKQAKYPCFGYPFEGFPQYNKVVYAIFGKRCYFCGIEREARTSTINAAEHIIKSIATLEKVPVTTFRYFDLQTHAGYKKPSGVYELDELIFEMWPGTEEEGVIEEIEIEGEKGVFITQDKEGLVVNLWKTSLCPVDVLELFWEYIGEPNQDMKCKLCGWEGKFSECRLQIKTPISYCSCPECNWTLANWRGHLIQKN
jgi:hypothetical protein